MHLTATGEPRTSSAAKVLVAQAALVIARVASGEPVAQEALAGLAAQEVRVALAVPEDPVVRAALAVREDPVVRAALVVPEDPVVRAVPENPAAPENLEVLENPVALAVPENLVVPGPETALEAVPERDPVAVPVRTKSVIARHPRGLVLAPRVEDLAAAAETTRVPVAAEVGKAWEAAA
jgi:hypothetical protein